MRVIYVVAGFFLLLCVFFTRWYLCDVRGLCGTPATAEILLMLLASFFIGFAASWLLSEEKVTGFKKESMEMGRARQEAENQSAALEKENVTTRRQLADWQQEALSLGQQRRATEERLWNEQTRASSLQDDLQLAQRRYESLKGENDSLRESAEGLKKQLTEQPEKAEEVTERESTVEEALEAHELFRSRFTPSSWQTRKDDLSLISGIGPVIHRKLNELGIYSFKQISELTPAMVKRISEAIKFFPDRIGRDNWIGQAAALMRRK